MATERVEMHVLREILRQKLGLGRSHRQVATSVGVSAGKVAGVFTAARALGLDTATIDAMSDAELDARLHPKVARPGWVRSRIAQRCTWSTDHTAGDRRCRLCSRPRNGRPTTALGRAVARAPDLTRRRLALMLRGRTT
jgi:hypothetical protein